jgi:hypothetical protein
MLLMCSKEYVPEPNNSCNDFHLAGLTRHGQGLDRRLVSASWRDRSQADEVLEGVVVARCLIEMDSEHVALKRVDSRISSVAVDRWKAVFKETKRALVRGRPWRYCQLWECHLLSVN